MSAADPSCFWCQLGHCPNHVVEECEPAAERQYEYEQRELAAQWYHDALESGVA